MSLFYQKLIKNREIMRVTPNANVCVRIFLFIKLVLVTPTTKLIEGVLVV